MPNILINRKLQAAYAALGALIGVSVFFSFSFVIHNWAAGILGLASGLFALWNCICVLFRHTSLPPTGGQRPLVENGFLFYVHVVAGILGLTTGLGTMAYFLLIAGVEQQAVTGTSGWVSAVWGFMLSKWALGLLVHVFRYHHGKPDPARSLSLSVEQSSPLLSQ